MAMYNKESSKIKMLVYLKNGKAEVYYSALKEDKKGVERAIKGLHQRILLGKLKLNYHTAIMYNNIKDIN